MKPDEQRTGDVALKALFEATAAPSPTTARIAAMDRDIDRVLREEHPGRGARFNPFNLSAAGWRSGATVTAWLPVMLPVVIALLVFTFVRPFDRPAPVTHDERSAAVAATFGVTDASNYAFIAEAWPSAEQYVEGEMLDGADGDAISDNVYAELFGGIGQVALGAGSEFAGLDGFEDFATFDAADVDWVQALAAAQRNGG